MAFGGAIISGLVLAISLLPPQAKERGDAAALDGTWTITSINGQSAPEGTPPLTLTFAGGKYHQVIGDDINERGAYSIDAAKKPMTIDLSIVEGDDAGKTQLGILEITGDAMRLCLDIPGAGQRPTEFAAKDGALFVVGKKSKP